jgi:hypothetical protein
VRRRFIGSFAPLATIEALESANEPRSLFQRVLTTPGVIAWQDRRPVRSG